MQLILKFELVICTSIGNGIKRGIKKVKIGRAHV